MNSKASSLILTSIIAALLTAIYIMRAETPKSRMGLDGGPFPTHQDFLERAKKGDINVVFFGDSSTVCWQTTGRDIWDKNIAPLKAVNFGACSVNGEDGTAQGLLGRLQQGDLDGYAAKAIVIMIGFNNLRGSQSASEIAAVIAQCVAEVQKKQPAAQIFLFNPPRIKGKPNTLEADTILAVVGKNYMAKADDLAGDLAKLDDGKSVHVIDMSDALTARASEILQELAIHRDSHKVHVEFEVWWNALKTPFTQIFGAHP